MSYENAVATKLLATNCVVCGRPLVDALSVERGIGPECRKYANAGIEDRIRKAANTCVFEAAIAAQEGRIEKVMSLAQNIEEMGLTVLANKMRRRFKKAIERKSKITIDVEDDFFVVNTPFRRGDKKAFVNAWRNIPGRRFQKGLNYVPVTQKMALWKLLREFFGGQYADGPKGKFRIPKPDPKPEQMMFEQCASAAGQDPENFAEYSLAQKEMAVV